MDKENLFVSSNQVEQETKRKVVFTSSNATFMVLDNKSLYQNSTLSSAENRMNSNASSIPAIPQFRTVALSLRLDKNISMSPNSEKGMNIFDTNPEMSHDSKPENKNANTRSNVRRLPKNLNSLFDKCAPMSPASETDPTPTRTIDKHLHFRKETESASEYERIQDLCMSDKDNETGMAKPEAVSKRKLTERDMLNIMREKKRWKREGLCPVQNSRCETSTLPDSHQV